MKLLLFSLFLLLPMLSHAQFAAGDVFLGGDIFYRTATSSGGTTFNYTTKSATLSIVPTVGFFLNANFSLGARIGYIADSRSNSNTANSVSSNDRSGWLLGLEAKRFFALNEKFVFSLRGSASHSWNTDSYSASSNTTPTTTRNNVIGIGISPSFIFFATPRWGFEASVGNLYYSYDKEQTANKTGISSFYLDLNAVSIGVSYYFRTSANAAKTQTKTN